MNFIDLFAGAGGLSEGFIRAGYRPIAHVELDNAACFTLRTRAVYHFLKDSGRIKEYYSYLKGEINRSDLYQKAPQEVLNSVINAAIGKNNRAIFKEIQHK
jgi:DNA (cytosine-5)-methyltransferase 1